MNIVTNPMRLVGISSEISVGPHPYPEGSEFYATDTGDTYILNDEGEWTLKINYTHPCVWNSSTLEWEKQTLVSV